MNIWSIPRYTVKTKTSLRSIHNQVYFCNIILQTTLPSFTPWSLLIDDHCEPQSEFFANVRIGWTSFRLYLTLPAQILNFISANKCSRFLRHFMFMVMLVNFPQCNHWTWCINWIQIHHALIFYVTSFYQRVSVYESGIISVIYEDSLKAVCGWSIYEH